MIGIFSIRVPNLLKILQSVPCVRVAELSHVTLFPYIGLHKCCFSDITDHQQTLTCCYVFFCYTYTQGIFLKKAMLSCWLARLCKQVAQ